MTSSVWDAYLEFTCADEATQSELWDKSIEALVKNPPQNLRLSEKEGSVQTMMNEQDPQTEAEPLEGNPYPSHMDRQSDSQAQSSATLALAFEQRTANLLEMLNYTTEPEAFNTLMRTIEKRVGL